MENGRMEELTVKQSKPERGRSRDKKGDGREDWANGKEKKDGGMRKEMESFG